MTPPARVRSTVSSLPVASQRNLRCSLLVALALLACLSSVHGDETNPNADGEQYKTAREAFNAGARHVRAREYAKSREPLEAALRLAPDDAFRARVYQALMPAYRELPDVDKMVEACDFQMRHATSPARRSLVRSSLVSFTFQRGKADEVAAHFEKALAADADDIVALYVLSELQARLKKDPQRASQLLKQLLALQKEDDPARVATMTQLATQYTRQKQFAEAAALHEQVALLDKPLAAWHYKDAALAWGKSEQWKKALAAADKADQEQPEQRTEQLAHFFHRQLGETFLAAGAPRKALPHLRQAIELTQVEGYIEACQKLLARAEAESAAP